MSSNIPILDNESEYSLATNRSERSRYSHRKHKEHGGRRHKNKGEKSVTICAPSNGQEEHRQGEGLVVVNMPERTENDNWGETNTFISATTDVTQLSQESLAKLAKETESSARFRDCGFVAMVIFSLVSYLSPIAIAIIPHLWLTNPLTTACKTACKGTLIGMAFKLLLLLFASWAIFFRRQRTNMPRVFMFRTLILFLVLLITLTYWLFFVVWIVDQREEKYEDIANFADSYTNCLLFIHYLSLVLIELRQLQTMFVLEVIRTTDGERRFYNVGDLSIQRCSVWVLEKYYCDFPLYNPALLRTPSRSSRSKQVNKSSFKFYNVDGEPGEDTSGRMRAVMVAAARRRDAGHNERYYEEAEYERRIRKRRARLVAATEDAFTHIRRVSEGEATNTKSNVMEPKEAAENIFPALARSLQKYLRTTRQHMHYEIEDIIGHLADCIRSDMSPRAFLERYLHPGPYLTYSPRHDSSQWKLISDEPLVNMIKNGTVFRLTQGDYSLLVTAHRSPRIRLKEKFVDSSDHRFVMHMQSETSL